MRRLPENPIITPADVKPSAEGFRVRGAFNPGATLYRGGESDEVLLLLRVAEDVPTDESQVGVPIVNLDGDRPRVEALILDRDDPDVTLKDTRGVTYRGVDYLSTLSHLRLARSTDGVNFTVDEKPFLMPRRASERFGIEDARITYLADGPHGPDRYYINYTIVSPDNWATALSSTTDFRTLDDHGVIFHPSNKDVSIFPDRIDGGFAALHRPNNDGFGKASIWYARSPDLEHWGHHHCLLRPRNMASEAMKIGGGPPCIRTDRGWLQMYHGKGEGQRYTLHLALLALDDPSQVLARTSEPIFEPTEH